VFGRQLHARAGGQRTARPDSFDVLVHEDVAVEGDAPLAQEAGVEEVPPATLIAPAGEEEPGRHLLVARLHHSL
jgi:hypothetical protein